jgi:predicted phosphodiesterase
MRLAVISDIHGNLEAFLRVLEDILATRVDMTVCLGDNVGYGPEPELVVRQIRDLEIPCVIGNHELALVDSRYLDWFNSLAQQSIALTSKLVSPNTLEYCRGLPKAMTINECLCVHGCPPDSALTYIFEPSIGELIKIMQRMTERMCFVGHTHSLEIFEYNGLTINNTTIKTQNVHLTADHKYIINVGSVGQPRDGSNSAKYVIWDDESQDLEIRFVAYDIAATADKILRLGWPRFLADRLW